MTKQDFSHFKYYEKRLKEMGFENTRYDETDGHCCMDFVKSIGGDRWCDVHCAEHSVCNKDYYPYIMLHVLHGGRNRTCVVIIYKIGFDKDFPKKCKPRIRRMMREVMSRRVNVIINEYPTWRYAFNQLVKDYHELEKNACKRIHKGVSIHET